MPTCRESTNSPAKRDDGSIERIYIVDGTTDELQAEALAYAYAPAVYRGLSRNSPDVRPAGRGIYECTFAYNAQDDSSEETSDEPQGDLPTLGTLEIDGAGGTEHVTQCRMQIGYANVVNVSEIEQRRIVGLHKDGVNGVDIDVPGSTIVLTKKWLPQAVTGSYVKGLLDLRSKVNLSPWTLRWGFKGNLYQIEFPQGELRYQYTRLSTGFTRAGTDIVEISYAMIHAKNEVNIQLATGSAPLLIPTKGGHDYLWALYKKEELTGGYKATIETPEAAFVAQMYERVNFQSVLGF